MLVAATSTRFHRLDCRSGQGYPVVPLSKVTVPACRNCFSDAPRRTKVIHRFCTKCNKRLPHPCPHNGGVLVEQEYRVLKKNATRSPDEILVRRVWTWPDSVPLNAKVLSAL